MSDRRLFASARTVLVAIVHHVDAHPSNLLEQAVALRAREPNLIPAERDRLHAAADLVRGHGVNLVEYPSPDDDDPPPARAVRARIASNARSQD
ncbi:MAG: hypothetical protein ACREXP_23935 [Steroidobacteraceae bacterium]